MTLKKFKYDGSGTHRRAILHMIGESLDVFKTKPKVSDIASWMRVSKPTAIRYLKRMVDNEELIETKVPYRQTFAYRYELHPDVMEHYEEGRLKFSYEIYAQRVLQVILT